MNQSVFRSVKAYCTFIGYPRSGHSIIGSLLDAHPEVVIAHELDALKYLSAGFGRAQLYSLLLDKSRLFKKRGAVSSGYSYLVPSQHQGEFTSIAVIGDKKGAGTIKRLQDDPTLLDRLQSTVGDPVKYVHVLRNPYDNIATITTRKQKLDPPPTLDDNIEYYFSLVATVADLKRKLPAASVLDIRLEDFIADPPQELKRMCSFLGVSATPEYLQDCAAIVYDSPNKSRDKVKWSDDQRDEVARQSSKYDFLEGYTFDS